jgi:hypothetical protein
MKLNGVTLSQRAAWGDGRGRLGEGRSGARKCWSCLCPAVLTAGCSTPPPFALRALGLLVASSEQANTQKQTVDVLPENEVR